MITVGHLVAFSLVLIGAIALALYGIRYRSKTFEVGKFPVFRPLSDEVGRAAEEGALIHIALGNGSGPSMGAGPQRGQRRWTVDPFFCG